MKEILNPMKRIFLFLKICLCNLFLFTILFSQTPQNSIIINEFTVNPTSGKEYVELLTVVSNVSISGFRLSDEGTKGANGTTTEGHISFLSQPYLNNLPKGTRILIILSTPSANLNVYANEDTDISDSLLILFPTTIGGSLIPTGTMDISTSENIVLLDGPTTSANVIDYIAAGSNTSQPNYTDARWSNNLPTSTPSKVNYFTNDTLGNFINDNGVIGWFVNQDTTDKTPGMKNKNQIFSWQIIPTFTIVSTSGENGKISPNGNIILDSLSNQTFVITPNSNYHIDSVFVDGNYIGNNSTYTFENIISNHTIHATFSIDKFNLTTNATNGSITKVPDLPIYNYGTEVTLTANPNLGYHFVNWSGDLSTAINPVSIVINGNKNVTANFSIDQFTITSTSGENGTIVPNVNTTVNYGDDLSITISANVGYHIDSVFVDGNYIGNDSTYTFENIISNHTIHATFQFIDTTKYRTFLSSQYGGKSPSLKRKKGIVQNLSQPSNIRDLVIIKESGITIGKSVTKDSAKFYGWIYFKDGKSMTSFFPGIGTKSYPFDSIRTEKKPKIFVKQLSNPKAKTILNHLATEIATFHINNLASKTTPKILSDDVLENLIYKDTSDEFGFSGLSLSQILDSANLYLTYYKKIPLETRENYFNTLDSIFTRVNREFYIGEITSNDTSHLPFRIFGGKKITEAIYFERTNSKVFSNNISIEKFSPTKFSLQQNFPNPFNPNTTISFSLVDVENNVSLKIYDILGRKVSTLLDNENLESGFYEIDFDANNLNSGIYFYKLTTNNFSEMKKMILIK